jgi:serine beta-lactamase-like protein LACTB, mitochondrial
MTSKRSFAASVIRMLLGALLLGLMSTAHAETPPNTLDALTSAAVDEAVTKEMTALRVIGVAVGIISKGQIVYLKGYGLADRENGVPVTTGTVFNWARDCKPMTAVAALQLVEQGKLDLDADVRKYVPEFPDKGVTITTRELLCHQSGIPHYADGKGLSDKTLLPSPPHTFSGPVEALKVFSDSPLIFKPGEDASYSSYAYILLSAVIERAGKKGFMDQINERITTPLGMKSLQLDTDSAGHHDWAVGYTQDAANNIVRAEEEANYWKYGSAGFKSDIKDFALWAQALLNHKLVSPETEQAMWTPQKTSLGKTTIYGLGFNLDVQDNLRVSFSGIQSEATSRMVLYPNTRDGIVILTNSGFINPGVFSSAIFKALATSKQ